MQVNVETLQMRIDRLKNLIAECPSDIDVPEEIRHILKTAPQMLNDAESALQSNDPMLFEQLHEALEQTEVLVTWGWSRRSRAKPPQRRLSTAGRPIPTLR